MEMCAHYHWQPRFWAGMGWRELQSLIAEHNRRRERALMGQVTAGESWSQGRDAWWQAQDADRKSQRGY